MMYIVLLALFAALGLCSRNPSGWHVTAICGPLAALAFFD